MYFFLLQKDKAPSEEISIQIVKLAHLVGTNVIQGVATSNTSKDIVYGERKLIDLHFSYDYCKFDLPILANNKISAIFGIISINIYEIQI